jgi:3-dehydroquinate dehydratase/shikimate dehydrogenase
MPYKEAILKHLDKTDPISQKVGACNTVIRSPDGKLSGFNTDVAGVVRPIEQRMNVQGAKVLILGAGGAARAAVFGLKERGADL